MSDASVKVVLGKGGALDYWNGAGFYETVAFRKAYGHA
jgi:hypothetical protein